MQRIRAAISCFALVGVICLSVFLHQVIFKPDLSKESTDKESEGVPTLDTPISIAGSAPKNADSAQYKEEAPETTPTRNSSRTSNEDVDLTNPDTKTFELTDFRGEMKKGKLQNPPSVDISTHPSLSWFTEDASAIAFPDSKESSNRDYFYAWVQLNPNRMDSIERDTYKSLRVEIYAGGSEYRRVRLPRDTDNLKKLLAHEDILALGNRPINEKIGPNFREEIETSIASETKDVFITLMTTANLSHWRSEINKLGADIEHWDPTIRVLVASVPFGKLMDLAEWDFVQEVEPVGTVELMLDSAVPVSGADDLRTHLGVNGTFSGIDGRNVTIGVMDSGLNLSHPDISEHRLSICGESFQTLENGQPDTDDLWVDFHGHGTHVTSILAGTGSDNSSRAGFAPGVRHIRFAKAFTKDPRINFGGASTTAILQSMDYFAKESSCMWNGAESAAMKPNVVNMSLGSVTGDTGDRIGARKLDWAVWNHDQLYVVSQGNSRYGGYSEYGSAKNALPVAWLTDALYADFLSSRGPVSDGRMIPKVGMTGDSVLAADGHSATSGYVNLSGTSMSSPAVAGIATLLMGTDVTDDTVDGFKTNPALVRAQLMATAIKPDAQFELEAFAPRTNTRGTGYVNNQTGMGAVSARTAIRQGPNGEWSSHSAVSEIDNDEYAYIEIDVPENTDRLDIVLTWDEPPNDNVGSAVMADLDLYLGPDEDCDVTVCGEYVSSSRVDNLEYLIIRNPETGTKRITVIPHNTFQFEPQIAVAWMFLANATPQLDIELATESLNTANTRRPQLDLKVSVDEFVAGGASLHITCHNERSGDCDYWYDSTESLWQPGSRVMREDGTYQNLTGLYIGDPVFIGEVASDETQNVTLVFPPAMKTGSHQLYVSVSSTNAVADVDAVNIIVDGQTLPSQSPTISNNYATTALELTGESGTVSVDLAAGARHPGELLIDRAVLIELNRRNWQSWPASVFARFTEGYSLSRSAWYKLSTQNSPAKYEIQVTRQAPFDANVSFQLISEDNIFDPLPANIWTTDQLEFYLQPNKNYYLRVNTYWTSRTPELTFAWQKLGTKPVNDDFADRMSLTGESGDVSGNNAYATVEIGEPGGHVSFGTTWFSWTAPSDGFWTFEADATYADSSMRVLVFTGDSVDNLRLVSDPAYFDADIPVTANQEYKICVSSHDRRFINFQGAYELSWKESTSSKLMSNDMFSEAIEISGAQGSRSKCNPCNVDDRTIEVGEPEETNSHSLWWKWEAPGTGKFTFRLSKANVDTLSAFVGSTLSTLTFQTSGAEIVIDATSGTEYYIVIHRHNGLEYSYDVSNNSFLWGPTPEYDRISTALEQGGTTGSATLALKYATTTVDESRAHGLTTSGVYSSVWIKYTPTPGYEGWLKFETETWEEANLRNANDQYFLGIHKEVAENKYELVASTDRSFIIGGRPEAIFKPEANTEYLVQIALRSNTTTLSTNQSEVDIEWAESRVPPWLESDLNFYEVGGSTSAQNIAELIDPTAGSIVGRGLDKMLLTAEDQMLVLGLSDDPPDLDVIETIQYEDVEGIAVNVPTLSVLGWHKEREALYSPKNTGFVLFEGLDQSAREVSNCNVENDFPLTPTQVLHEGTGRYIYKIGDGTIAVYQIDGPCELTLIQVLTASTSSHSLLTGADSRLFELEGFHSAVFGPRQIYLYGLSDDRILTFEKDGETGMLSKVSETLHSDWLPSSGLDANSDRFDGASIALAHDGNHLFAVGKKNPAVAVFELQSETRSVPMAVSAIDHYYISRYIDWFSFFFPSHIRYPIPPRTFGSDEEECLIHGFHRSDIPAIEVICPSMIYVVAFETSERELYISDWSSVNQRDRFGNQIPQFRNLAKSFGMSRHFGKYSYVVVNDWIDSIHRFERVTGGVTMIEEPDNIVLYDDHIVRLVAMDIRPGAIKLGSTVYSECTPAGTFEVEDDSYEVHSSQWQVREKVGDDWEDHSADGQLEGQLCPLTPTDNQEYRLEFEVTINGTRKNYSSNVMQLPASN